GGGPGRRRGVALLRDSAGPHLALRRGLVPDAAGSRSGGRAARGGILAGPAARPHRHAVVVGGDLVPVRGDQHPIAGLVLRVPPRKSRRALGRDYTVARDRRAGGAAPRTGARPPRRVAAAAVAPHRARSQRAPRRLPDRVGGARRRPGLPTVPPSPHLGGVVADLLPSPLSVRPLVFIFFLP